MAWELFANARSIGLVSDYRYLEGRQEAGMFASFGGETESTTSVKESDEVFFVAPAYGLNPRDSYELRSTDSRQVLKLQIDTIYGAKVHALIRSDNR